MNERFSVLAWSVPCGRWLSTQVRISVFFVFVPMILMVRFGVVMGSALTGALFLATLLHEFGHVMACRAWGGAAEEILIWPLGGLASLHYPRSTSGRCATIVAGPAVNLFCCLATWPSFYAPDQLRSVLLPIELPVFEFTAASWPVDASLVFFAANWLLLALNLLPAWPLDGGQLVWTRWHAQSGTEAAMRGTTMVGMACGWLGLAVGLMGNWPWVVALGAVLLTVNLSLWQQHLSDDSEGDSFLGYDFSEGFTSFEQTHSDRRPEPRPSWWQRWQQRRREQKEVREQTRIAFLEQQLDILLAKVHEQGLESLTAQERRQLREASETLRERPKRS